VTASASTAPDADTTVVATSGTLTVGDKTITIDGAVTLKQLSAAINADADAPARASIVQSGASQFKLVLTAKSTGEAHSFSITNALTGGAGIAFTDTDNDGVSGDSAGDNAVQATDAQLLVNNIAVTSTSNILDAAIPGSTITLYKKDPAATVVVEVAADSSALKTKLQTFASAYNDLVKFATDQNTSAGKGDQASLGRDPVMRTLRNTLRSALTAAYNTGGPFKYLSEIGVEMTQSGTIQIKDSVFNDAIKNGASNATTLLAGTTGTPGALASINTLLENYTQSSGLLRTARDQATAQVTRLGTQIIRMQERLAVRRTALQQEFTAADAAMSQLKNQSGSLSAFGQSL
jgi:flagellar hook-associated protein 2